MTGCFSDVSYAVYQRSMVSMVKLWIHGAVVAATSYCNSCSDQLQQ